ncbi:hypothetical protein BJ508DRAFT_308359 [Ascobolus immersus RN42]|uniref:Uncharacterized protein n=1 Tax=Ascobolus immersus RN42 TaxID=1160509 RepID=A0A3N4I416_ASCIM|nr:hypothetical protein BJ508DRAFT_308359 [Ascobolus immersus RN42]
MQIKHVGQLLDEEIDCWKQGRLLECSNCKTHLKPSFGHLHNVGSSFLLVYRCSGCRWEGSRWFEVGKHSQLHDKDDENCDCFYCYMPDSDPSDWEGESQWSCRSDEYIGKQDGVDEEPEKVSSMDSKDADDEDGNDEVLHHNKLFASLTVSPDVAYSLRDAESDDDQDAEGRSDKQNDSVNEPGSNSDQDSASEHCSDSDSDYDKRAVIVHNRKSEDWEGLRTKHVGQLLGMDELDVLIESQMINCLHCGGWPVSPRGYFFDCHVEIYLGFDCEWGMCGRGCGRRSYKIIKGLTVARGTRCSCDDCIRERSEGDTEEEDESEEDTEEDDECEEESEEESEEEGEGAEEESEEDVEDAGEEDDEKNEEENGAEDAEEKGGHESYLV